MAHCNTLQHTATQWIALEHTATHKMTGKTSHCNTLQHTAYYNTLKRTKRRVGVTGTISHCYTLKRIYNTLQHASRQVPRSHMCNASLQHTGTYCSTCNTLQTYQNKLQYMQHTASKQTTSWSHRYNVSKVESIAIHRWRDYSLSQLLNQDNKRD